MIKELEHLSLRGDLRELELNSLDRLALKHEILNTCVNYIWERMKK